MGIPYVDWLGQKGNDALGSIISQGWPWVRLPTARLLSTGQEEGE